jgi:hypothetical protein
MLLQNRHSTNNLIVGVNACLKTAINHLNSPVNAGVEKRAQLNGAFGPMLIIQCLASLSDVSWNFRLCTENGH